MELTQIPMDRMMVMGNARIAKSSDSHQDKNGKAAAPAQAQTQNIETAMRL
jgi:hypothetical protein